MRSHSYEKPSFHDNNNTIILLHYVAAKTDDDYTGIFSRISKSGAKTDYFSEIRQRNSIKNAREIQYIIYTPLSHRRPQTVGCGGLSRHNIIIFILSVVMSCFLDFLFRFLLRTMNGWYTLIV